MLHKILRMCRLLFQLVEFGYLLYPFHLFGYYTEIEQLLRCSAENYRELVILKVIATFKEKIKRLLIGEIH